jgi:16S rRNA (guanine966-N2)-methyltransferase
MRVVAGAFKGRRLQAPAGRRTRPTADRVREAVFSILGAVDGLRVLDLFAGSGALGIEALSRGAERAVFVDRDLRAVAAVRSNLARLGAQAPVYRRDALAFLVDAATRAEQRFDLVFLDPPYSSADRLAGPLSERLPAALTDNARIVSESDKRSPLALVLPIERQRAYGDTLITIHRAR